MEAVAEKLESQTAATQAMREQLEAQSAELAAARASKNELASEVATLRAEKDAASHALSRQQSVESSGSGVGSVLGSGIKRATGSGRLARVWLQPPLSCLYAVTCLEDMQSHFASLTSRWSGQTSTTRCHWLVSDSMFMFAWKAADYHT